MEVVVLVSTHLISVHTVWHNTNEYQYQYVRTKNNYNLWKHRGFSVVSSTLPWTFKPGVSGTALRCCLPRHAKEVGQSSEEQCGRRQRRRDFAPTAEEISFQSFRRFRRRDGVGSGKVLEKMRFFPLHLLIYSTKTLRSPEKHLTMRHCRISAVQVADLALVAVSWGFWLLACSWIARFDASRCMSSWIMVQRCRVKMSEMLLKRWSNFPRSISTPMIVLQWTPLVLPRLSWHMIFSVHIFKPSTLFRLQQFYEVLILCFLWLVQPVGKMQHWLIQNPEGNQVQVIVSQDHISTI